MKSEINTQSRKNDTISDCPLNMIVFGKVICFIWPSTLAGPNNYVISVLQLNALIPAKMQNPGRANNVPSIIETFTIITFHPSEQWGFRRKKHETLHVSGKYRWEELFLNFSWNNLRYTFGSLNWHSPALKPSWKTSHLIES